MQSLTRVACQPQCMQESPSISKRSRARSPPSSIFRLPYAPATYIPLVIPHVMQRHIVRRAFSSSAFARSEQAEAVYRPNKRQFDSLASGLSNPNAHHFILKDRPSLQFVVRPAPSPVPPTQPYVHSPAGPSAFLPPRLHPEADESTASRSRLDQSEIASLQALRLSDPIKWTTGKLAEKYNVSRFFVSLVGFGDSAEAKAAEKLVKARHEQEETERSEKWGMQKRIDREVRRRRKDFW